MLFVENIIPISRGFVETGSRIALATLVRVEGSSPRPLGSQICVADDGRAVGMISGGCAEKAIITEAVRSIEDGENKIVRYGKGSPYLDVVLPCGSGIDIYIETKSSAEIVNSVDTSLAQRRPVRLDIDLEALKSTIAAPADSHIGDNVFQKIFEPSYRILVFGEGANLVTFATLAKDADFEVIAYTPDEDARTFLAQSGISGAPIYQGMDLSTLEIDEYSAIVTLFHEHEWENDILCAALNSSAHYIGALGSRRTHDERLEALAAKPPTRRPPHFINGPVGLGIGAQSPSEIAVAILAEIIAQRRLP